MTNVKRKVIAKEIEEFKKYYPNLNINYQDYFESHVMDNGDIVSLETYIKNNELSNEQTKKYYEINDAFIEAIFKDQKPLYFFDVDNTITIHGALSKEKQQFMDTFPDKNRIILSTGKAYESIMDVVSACNLESNYASCINGSVLVKNGSFEMINGIGEVSEELFKRINKTSLDFIYYYVDGAYGIRKLKPYNQASMEKYNEHYRIDSDVRYKDVIKILLFIYEGETEKEKLVKDMINDLPHLTCMRTAPHSYEILRLDQHKGNTVKIISARLNKYYRLSIGAGDSMNDLKMLDYVGMPFIVCDANKELKDYKFKELDQNRKIDIVKLIEEYR